MTLQVGILEQIQYIVILVSIAEYTVSINVLVFGPPLDFSIREDCPIQGLSFILRCYWNIAPSPHSTHPTFLLFPPPWSYRS